MTAAHRVLRQQDIAGMDRENLLRGGLELQRAGQGDDELAGGSVMRRKGAARPGFTELNTRRHGLVAQEIAVLALRKVDCSFLEQRIAIIARPDPHAPYHCDCFLHRGWPSWSRPRDSQAASAALSARSSSR